MVRKVVSLGPNSGNPRICRDGGDRGTGAGKGYRSSEVLENPERAMGVSSVGAWRAVQKKGIGEPVGGQEPGMGEQVEGRKWRQKVHLCFLLRCFSEKSLTTGACGVKAFISPSG